ncbi:hypothetical protein GCM10028820_16990 [Tessaracoccus terricola]
MQFRNLARTAAVWVAALLALTGCTGEEGPTQDPTEPDTTAATTPAETTEPTTDETSAAPETDEPFDPLTGEPAPPLPGAFGDWTADGEGSQVEVAYYEQAGTGAQLTATVWVYSTKEEVQESIPNSVNIGQWLCGADPEHDGWFSCTANAWDGTVQLLTDDLDAEGLAAAGDELLAAWQ